jgi:hypothetical protein
MSYIWKKTKRKKVEMQTLDLYLPQNEQKDNYIFLNE